MRKRWQIVTGAALVLCASGLSYPAQAGDFFSNLFGGFARPPMPRAPTMIPFGDDAQQPTEAPRPRVAYWRRPGLVRADLRRTLFPDHRA